MADPISPIIPGVQPADRITESKPVDRSQAPSKAIPTAEGDKSGNEFGSEGWNLSSEGRERIQFAKIQYHLVYVVLSAMNALAEQTDPTENLPLPALSEKVQEIATTCLISSSGGNTSPDHQPFDHPPSDQSPSVRTLSERMAVAAESGKAGITSQAESDDMNELTRLLSYFSPESTAQRLLDAAAILFNAHETAQTQDSNETRRSFFESIARAIDEAFKQVLQRAGKLTTAVQKEVDKTRSLIISGLQTFSDNGIDTESIAPEGSAMERLDTFCRESVQRFDRLEKITARGGYNSHGMFHLMSTETFSKKG